ncbi:MAG: hypothetical protein JWL77_6284 [Chthonomonadaceae bacterium]|jgi:hypothetical protein|nr:hypothetical protein [Chthonomonadaceae bacterium]
MTPKTTQRQERNIARIWQMRLFQVQTELAKREPGETDRLLIAYLRLMQAAIETRDEKMLYEAGQDWFARTRVIPPAFVGIAPHATYFPGHTVPVPIEGKDIELQACHPQLYR